MATTPTRAVAVATVWLVVTGLSMLVVVYGLEPTFTAGTQARLLTSYRAAIDRAANARGGLGGVIAPTHAPELGAPVAILEIGRVRLQQVVVEGVLPSQTQAGPGHVPGTAAPGQPGNSAIVARRSTFGGPFHNLDRLQADDAMVVTTTQGQLVYQVISVRHVQIGGAASDAAGASAPDDLYASTKDDRLTLVTSGSNDPTNSTAATVVVARLKGLPFSPTPQNGRTPTQSGLGGESATSSLVLGLLGFAASASAAAVLYRRSTFRVAYLLMTPALVAFVVVAAESASRLLPAWM